MELEQVGVEADGLGHPADEFVPPRQAERHREARTEKRDQAPFAVRPLEPRDDIVQPKDAHDRLISACR